MDAMITSAQVLERVGMRDAIAAIERAFQALDAGHIAAPVSVGVAVPDGTFHVKACAANSPAYTQLFVAKINSNFPGNRACDGLPTIQGVIAVFDAGTGKLRALMDSPAITSLRTAATTAVAIRHLAQKGARVATLVGCGALGLTHLQALAVCGIGRVNVFDLDAGRATGLAAWACDTLGMECLAVTDLRVATLASEVVVTCTTSRVPFLKAGDVRPGTFIAAVGADNERKSEIAASLLAEARIVTDLTAQCRKTGDLRNAVPNESFVCGELVDVVAGRVARTASDEIVVFDSSGLAIEDLALCALVLEKTR
jgi:ornithine cyclodeaminase/alanine dehydrogenase-like protein (mu-crystallin family)